MKLNVDMTAPDRNIRHSKGVENIIVHIPTVYQNYSWETRVLCQRHLRKVVQCLGSPGGVVVKFADFIVVGPGFNRLARNYCSWDTKRVLDD